MNAPAPSDIDHALKTAKAVIDIAGEEERIEVELSRALLALAERPAVPPDLARLLLAMSKAERVAAADTASSPTINGVSVATIRWRAAVEAVRNWTRANLERHASGSKTSKC